MPTITNEDINNAVPDASSDLTPSATIPNRSLLNAALKKIKSDLEQIELFLSQMGGGLKPENNLSDLLNVIEAQENLGLGGAATRSVSLIISANETGDYLIDGEALASFLTGDVVRLGSVNSVSGEKVIAIGAGAIASKDDALSIGKNSQSVTKSGVAIGDGSFAGDNLSTGQKQGETIAIGKNAKANTFATLALGFGAENGSESGAAIGHEALVKEDSPWSIAIGQSTVAGDGSWSGFSKGAIVAIGRSAQGLVFGDIAIGGNAKSEGYKAVSFGHGSNSLSPYALALGADSTADGDYAVAIGREAKAEYNNSVSIGRNSSVTGTYQIQLGSSNASVYAYGTVNDRSDRRDKADIKDTRLGLDFIMKLKPRSFKWDYRDDYRQKRPEDYDNWPEEQKIAFDESQKLENITHDGTHKRNRDHQGFIAQEVKDAMDELGLDFSGYQDHKINGGQDVLTLGYSDFIAPMVKAMQEQQAVIEQLKSRLEALEGK